MVEHIGDVPLKLRSQANETQSSKSGPKSKIVSLDLSAIHAIAGLQGILAGFTFENWDPGIQQLAKEQALAFFDDWKGMVFWSRAYGSGKTYAACAVLHEWLRCDIHRKLDVDLNIPAYYVHGGKVIPNGGIEMLGGMMVRVPDMFSRLKDSLQPDSQYPKESYVVGLMQKTPLLVLDDLGRKQELSPYENEVIYRIVDYRLVAQKPLIVTTNLAPSELLEALWDATYSRLKAMCKFVHLEEKDYR